MPLVAEVGVLCVVAAALVGLAIWALRRSRSTPEKRERARRLALQTTGRIGDALLTEVHNDTFYYTYTLRGVQYVASQDVSSLRDQLPPDPERLIGMVGMKYAQKNPANSLVICEEWSGLRAPLSKSNAASTESANGNAVGHQPQDPAAAQGS